MERLKEIFLAHKGKISDKWQLYIETWDELFEEFREQPVKILEIGIQNGGSLEVWAEYFKNASCIVGCDIEEKCGELNFSDPRIQVVVGDVLNESTLSAIKQISPEYTIIIDDGSHKSSDIIKTFGGFFPVLEFGGIYIAEDLHASYWSLFEGGLYEPFSAKAFLCRLVDLLNFEHWHKRTDRLAYLEPFFSHYGFLMHEQDLGTLHSIKFLNSLCIIRKDSPQKNQLGLRYVKGETELVTEDWQKYNQTSIHDIASVWNDKSDNDYYEMVQEYPSLLDKINELNKKNMAILKRLYKQKKWYEKAHAELIKHQQKEYEDLKLITANKMNRELELMQSRSNKEIERLEQLHLDGVLELEQTKKELNEAKIELAVARAEIADYVSSTSWKITRPLRKLRGLMKRN